MGVRELEDDFGNLMLSELLRQVRKQSKCACASASDLERLVWPCRHTPPAADMSSGFDDCRCLHHAALLSLRLEVDAEALATGESTVPTSARMQGANTGHHNTYCSSRDIRKAM